MGLFTCFLRQYITRCQRQGLIKYWVESYGGSKIPSTALHLDTRGWKCTFIILHCHCHCAIWEICCHFKQGKIVSTKKFCPYWFTKKELNLFEGSKKEVSIQCLHLGIPVSWRMECSGWTQNNVGAFPGGCAQTTLTTHSHTLTWHVTHTYIHSYWWTLWSFQLIANVVQ